MKGAIAALALIGCGSKTPPRGPEHDLDVATPPANPSIDAAPAAQLAAPVPALAGDGPHAFVADGGGLLEVAPDGKTQQIVATTPGWCNADARANVVWFTADDGLYAFDLADRVVHPIVRGQLDATISIDWGNEILGGEDKVDYQLGLGVRMTTPPKVSSELGCDGDQAVYCYDDGGTTLRAELVDKQKKLDAVTLADPAYVATLVARGRDRSLWTPPPVPPAPPAKKPKIARKSCEEIPGDCGKLTALPGNPLWLVETANSRGDFFHETRELWDPADQAFVWLDGGKLVRSIKPQPGEVDTDYRDLRLAPSGGLMSIGGVVFDPMHVVYAPSGDLAITCGWSNGGWRIHSPTE